MSFLLVGAGRVLPTFEEKTSLCSDFSFDLVEAAVWGRGLR